MRHDPHEHRALREAREALALPRWYVLLALAVLLGTVVLSSVFPLGFAPGY